MRKLAQIQAFSGNFTPNIELTSSNWGTLTSDTAWYSKIVSIGGTGVLVKRYTLSTNTASFYLKTTNGSFNLDLRSLLITNVGYINIKNASIINFQQNQIVTFNPSIALPSGVIQLYLHTNQIVTFNPAIALPNSIAVLELHTNQIVTFNPSIALPSGLTSLRLDSNQIVTFNPSIALPSGLMYLYLSRQNISSLNPTIPLPNSLQLLYVDYCKFTSLSGFLTLPTALTLLDLTYNTMTTAGYTASEAWATAQATTTNCTIKLTGNTNSASGTTFASILLAKGYTLIY